MMDVTPSQEMVDERIAREVVNKIQKLRKKVRRRRRRSGRGEDGRDRKKTLMCLSSLGRLDYSHETQWRWCMK